MAKCKVKTKRSAAKRFRVTKNGKVLFHHAYKRRKTSKKKRSTLRALRLKGQLSSGDREKALRLLGVK
ncbi:MAG TPA: 50S ribosomal protein L35 [Kosmotoga arenicorallina]|uniref:Large ribosomal subunit protein bL35 n=1 Tax=Kosmotoga arenicorallina TaxID=688066 RepID=A0A7C5DVW6_9BACT|nr:50S ribosomal protein L35 [Thermotogaceae bacterium]RKX34972.1 MAG: 50S ribosomal protein L35 [Thermotogota bacterium]RKX40949.1 MAG: 50S ribosomal protein L35 [Thermotogota bacterium]HHF08761.1 50S ribosomal protein L35 [Kosmotoga arenicorallina]